MELTKITDNIYRTSAVETRKRVIQVIGSCIASVWLSVDGESYSQHNVQSVVDSAFIVVDIPVEGMMYVQLEGKQQPQILSL